MLPEYKTYNLVMLSSCDIDHAHIGHGLRMGIEIYDI